MSSKSCPHRWLLIDPSCLDDSIPWMTSLASAATLPTARSTDDAAPATSRSVNATASTTTSVCSTATPARPASPSAKAHPCLTVGSPTRRHTPSWLTWTMAVASDRPNGSSASIATRSSDWPAPPGGTPTTLTTSSWLFPPRTHEVQLDEKWSFVFKKQKNCDPLDPADDHKGDWWDHVAFDPEHKLVLAVVPGARVTESSDEVVGELKGRLGGQPPELITSDEHAPYETTIETTFSEVVPRVEGKPGRPRLLPRRRPVPGLRYATVRKEREKGRVVAVHRQVVRGRPEDVERVLKASVCSRTINTSFVERQHATDRGRNARKSRRTYRFSKDWRVHEAMTYFTMYRYNFCWPVRTLREQGRDGRWQKRTPAMAAGLADHVWSLKEWLRFPAIQCK
jgi:hypothetical protein